MLLAESGKMFPFTCGSVQVINFSSGEVGHGQNEFTKRVGFTTAMPSANLSIYINNTQESDSGRYICNVIIHGGVGLTGEMRLNVKGNGPLYSGWLPRVGDVYISFKQMSL